MCGITGIVNFGPKGLHDIDRVVSKMTDSIAHRGPDACDIWSDHEAGIAFGHRRLAIIDLSENGIQPMKSSTGRYILTYNGEIYNFREIRERLIAKGCKFKGHSDTEVILESIEVFGLEKTVESLIGMFAIALWDRHERCLRLLRDRMGIKPLYWSFENGLFLFGSELKALCEHPDFDKTIDKNALASYFRHNYIPAPYTIYKDAQKLEPGKLLTLSSDGNIDIREFWSLKNITQHAKASRFNGSDHAAVNALEKLLDDAVGIRMIADVSVGAFLSGGIDSSLVAAVMQKNASKPVKTFSIGFHEAAFNEAVYAKDVARHLGTEHTEFYVTGEDARNVIPQLPQMYDEPFSDSSQIPTYLVSKMTRDHVTVALSGDGGDELFAGYSRYTAASANAKWIFGLPKPLRLMAAAIFERTPASFWTMARHIAPPSLRFSNPANKAAKVARVLKGSQSDLYRTLVSHWENPDELVLDSSEHKPTVWNEDLTKLLPDFVEQMQYCDSITYLPDDILTKVDRASMAVSLEARVPLIDHRVVEFASSLPMNMKIRNGQSKWLLRQLLDRHVPSKLIDRPKMGFGVPLADWLRGPLKDWAGDMLSEGRLRDQAILDPIPVQEKWNEHLSGKKDWSYHLWDVIQFEAWHDHWMG